MGSTLPYLNLPLFWDISSFRAVIFNGVIPSQGSMEISRDTRLSQLGKEKGGGPSGLRPGLESQFCPNPTGVLPAPKKELLRLKCLQYRG